jgi:hypothetical protein
VKRYGKKGFTRKVIEVLREDLVDWEIRMNWPGLNYRRGRVTSEKLLKAAALLPKVNLGDRQNDSPTLRAFLRVAREEPRALFEVYVIDERRDDERLTVDGALIPADRQDLVEFLKGRAKAEPDEFGEVEVGGAKYVRMWWD